ncbi:MAG: ABC transporter substrate-binding protein [Hyphomonadaceae bacterium]|nr:ABC transporter substrate-binding protein [Hyphomonadaceae bacterium]
MGRFLVCALALLFASRAEAAPQRIVSLDYCADQFVLALADRAQIAALSIGAQRDDSYFRDRAVGIRQTRGSLEDVLALRPDLIVRNWGGPWDAAEVYGRFGVPVLQVGDAPSFAAARADLLHAAAAIGQAERGAALAADLDLRLARLHARAPAERPAVMYLSSAGAVAGSGVLMHDVIVQAGGRNSWSGASWTVLPLERLVTTPPALIATGFFGTGRTRMDAWSPSRHPVVRRALANARTLALPAGAISCEAWFAIDAAEAVQAALLAP